MMNRYLASRVFRSLALALAVMLAFVAIEYWFAPSGTVRMALGTVFSEWGLPGQGRQNSFEDQESRIAALEREVARLEYLEGENQRFKSLLKLQNQGNGFHIPARLMLQTPMGNWSEMIVNKGSQDGVDTNCYVIGHAGLLGRIVEVSENSSVVRLVSDSRSTVPVAIGVQAEQGVLYGNGKRSGIVRFVQDEEQGVKQGDMVYTSGLGMVYEPAIPVAQVVQEVKDSGGATRSFWVELLVHPSRVNQVYVGRRGRSPSAEN